MKKIIFGGIIIIAIVAAIFAWLIIGPSTGFSGKSKYLYIATGKTDRQSVLDSIALNGLVNNTRTFKMVAAQLDVWERLKPGRYKIEKGASVLSVARMLRNNNQSPVSLVINKLRTKQDLAKVIGKNFEVDSTEVISFITNAENLSAFNVDSNTLMTLIIPDTYSIFWTTPTNKILERLEKEKENFWKKNDRLQKASKLGLTPKQVYTIASIVEEETNKNDEKGNVASVYINRFRKGMPLGADPTIKFALNDFSLKRIYNKHLQVVSPYNTYRNQGLPPGPICTPSSKTIDAVLNAPKTDYLFFVAKSDFSGYHTFATNYTDHLKFAREYQKALDEYLIRKQNK